MRLIGYKLTLLVGVYLISVGLFAPAPDDLAPAAKDGKALAVAAKPGPMAAASPAAEAPRDAPAEPAEREPAPRPAPQRPPSDDQGGLLGLPFP